MPDGDRPGTMRTTPDRAVRGVGVLAALVLAAGFVAATLAPARAEAAAGPAILPAPALAAAPVVVAPPLPAVEAPPVPVPTTSTVLPPPPPPAPPTPPPVVVAPPVPAAPATDLQARVERALADAVPASWREGLPVTLRVIAGSTSYATGPGLVEVGDVSASGSWPHLLSVVAHEFGHLIAFRYGSGEYLGAAPTGWPDPGYPYPAEAWADCVAQAFTGVVDPSYDLPPCPPASLDWTARWLAGEI